MNILISAARQVSPQDDWLLLGTKHLLEILWGTTASEIQWVIYDPARVAPTKTNKNRLPNSFCHQTVLPFDAVVIAGTSGWTGPTMEGLYRPLSHLDIPLWAMGLELPTPVAPFTSFEHTCFHRPGTKITVTNETTREWLRRFDLESAWLCSPGLFAHRLATPSRQLVRGKQAKIAWLLSDRRSADSVSESFIRQCVKQIKKIETDYDLQKICLRVDDFMRFATLFPNQIKYSYRAADYLTYFSNVDLVVTTSPVAALVANGCEKPAILLGAEPATVNPRFPFIFPSSLQNITAEIQECLALTNVNYLINSWKEKQREEWASFLKPYGTILQKAA
jgi:hypothetical protein